MHTQAFSHILKRIGAVHANRRLELQTTHSAIRSSPAGIRLSVENLDRVRPLLQQCLKMSGLWPRGLRNSINYQITEHSIDLPSLPEPFQGFRILHLSDLHVEGILDRGHTLRETIRSLQFDLCVITGDYRLLTHGDYEKTLEGLTPIVKEIQCPHGIIGILGNHDYLEMVPGLENLGIRMLLNEAVPIQRGGKSIWIAGLDDAHWYDSADISKAFRSIPEETHHVRILLVHSPEVIPEAAEAGADVYLCGHSHGGQICLPGGSPIVVNSRCDRTFTRGSWQYEHMQGYTSRGIGTSLLPIRLSCRPEIVLHKLVSHE